MKYRIAWWASGKKNVEGRFIIHRGEPVFNSNEEAQQWAEDLNEKYPMLFHWVESVEV